MMLPIAILAGGYGTRLKDLTSNKPKALIEICGKPFIEWQLDLLAENGFSEVILCLSHKSEMIVEHLNAHRSRSLKIEYSFDGETQLGTGGAIRKALDKLGSKFAVLYGDSYLPFDFSRMQNDFLNSTRPALMAVFLNENLLDASNVRFKDASLIEYSKGTNNPDFKFIDYGITYLHADLFHKYESSVCFDFSDLLSWAARNDLLQGFEVSERFYEIGSFQGMSDFTKYIETNIK